MKIKHILILLFMGLGSILMNAESSSTIWNDILYSKGKSNIYSNLKLKGQEDSVKKKDSLCITVKSNFIQNVYWNKDIGGISGIEHLKDKTYLLLSDSGKVYQAFLRGDNSGFENAKMLTVKKGEMIKHPEAIRKMGNHLYISSDGVEDSLNKDLFIAKYKYTDSGLEFEQYVKTIDKFRYKRGRQLGLKGNSGIEGMAITENFLFYINERPLKEDNNHLILVRQDISSGKFNEFKYSLNTDTDNGVSELLAINDSVIIAIERQYVKGVGNRINIYTVKLNAGDSTCEKVQIFNRQSDAIMFYNIEAAVWLKGNCIETENQLLLLSDNNFDSKDIQKNQLLRLMMDTCFSKKDDSCVDLKSYCPKEDYAFNSKGKLVKFGKAKEGKVDLSVPMDITLKEQNAIIDEVNKKWMIFKDSILLICEKCSISDSLIKPIEILCEKDIQMNEANPKDICNGYFVFKQQSTEIELVVKNLYLERILALRSELMSELRFKKNCKINCNYDKEKRLHVFSEILSNSYEYDCESPIVNDWIGNIKKEFPCKDSNVQQIDEKLLKLYFIDQLILTIDKEKVITKPHPKKARYEKLIALTDNQINRFSKQLDDKDFYFVKINQLTLDGKFNESTQRLDLQTYQYLSEKLDKLRRLKIEYEDTLKSLKSSVTVDDAKFYRKFFIYKGTLPQNNDASDEVIVRTYDYSNAHFIGFHIPNKPGTIFNQSQYYNLSIHNLPGNQAYSIGYKTKRNGEEESLFMNVFDGIPGLTDMLVLVSKLSLPIPNNIQLPNDKQKKLQDLLDFTSNFNSNSRLDTILGITKADSINRKEILSLKVNEIVTNPNKRKMFTDELMSDKDNTKYNFNELIGSIANVIDDQSYNEYIDSKGIKLFKKKDKESKKKLADTCCCCKSMDKGVLCVDGEDYPVPKKLLKNSAYESICLNSCEKLYLEFMEFAYRTNENISPSKIHYLPIVEMSSTPAYQSISMNKKLNSFSELDSVWVAVVSNDKSVRIDSFYIGKYRRILLGIGAAYQFGFPFSQQYNNSQIVKVYQPKLVYTMGIKYHLNKTCIREPLIIHQNGKYSRPTKNNVLSKLFVYGGITISDKPYEYLFLGLGIDLMPGLSLSFNNRWAWESKIVVNNSNVFLSNGYSNPGRGTFGFSILIDPLVYFKYFQKK